MARRKKEFAHVYRSVDRHGKIRWRFIKGAFSCYLNGEYGSTQFIQEHEKAMGGQKISVKSAPYGTMNWVIEQYLKSSKHKNLAEPTKRTKIGKIEKVRKLLGGVMVKHIRAIHIEKIHDDRCDTPSAADALLKVLRQLLDIAIRKELIVYNVAKSVDLYNPPSDGFYVWTDEDIAKFENFHGVESKAVLALRLVLYLGAARQDVIRLGWQSIKTDNNGIHRIYYKRGKTKQDASLPIHHELADVLELADTTKMLFIYHGDGESYKPASFGNWFKDRCKEAGLDQCNSHGLRKAGATRLAEAGAGEIELMAYLAHSTPKEAMTYIKAVNREKLNDSGFKKLGKVSNLSNGLEKNHHNLLKTIEKG